MDNRVLKFDGAYNLGEDVYQGNRSEVFNHIFDKGTWAKSTGGESKSGSGSTIANTEIYRVELDNFLNNFQEKVSFFDAPCGDLNWIMQIKNFNKIDYVGGDVSSSLIAKLSADHPTLSLIDFDICVDTFPKADIWHCRHCLMHLSISDVHKALENFVKSGIEHALITTHFFVSNVTFDIPTGSFRPLDLHNPPFNFPKPKLYLMDSHPLVSQMQFATGLWSRTQISEALGL